MTKPIRIIRSPHDNRYFVLSRDTAQDATLSWEARGILVYLLSRPDDWEVQPQDLAQGISKNKVYKLLKELVDARYIVKDVERDDKQRFVRFTYTVYERPFDEKPFVEKREMGTPREEEPFHEKPQMEKPFVAKREHTEYREVQSTESLKSTEKESSTTTATRERANAFKLWEQEIGVLTPLVSDAIKDWLANYPPGWAEDAIREARLSSGKAIAPKYVQAILDRWNAEGKNAPRPATTTARPVARAPNGNGKHAPPAAPSTSEGKAELVRQKLREQKAAQHGS